MAGGGKSSINAKKLERYERIESIVKDRMALEAHMNERESTSEEIRFMREDAYCHIVQAVMGLEAASRLLPSEPQKSSGRQPAPKSGAKDSRRT